MAGPPTHGTVLDVVVAANFTADPLRCPFEFWKTYLGLRCELHFTPYDGVFSWLLQGKAFTPGQATLTVILVLLDEWLVRGGERAVRDLGAAVRQYCAATGGPLLAVQCKPRPATLRDPRAQESHGLLSTLLVEELKGDPTVALLQWQQLDALYPVEGDWWSPTTYSLAQIPYSEAYYTAVATVIARYSFGLLRRHVGKAVAVDGDHTLWAGAAAEDGPQGVRVVGVHQRLQRRLARAQAEGQLLCVVSRNEPADVQAVFGEGDPMPLRAEHVAAWQVNWEPKSTNVIRLARELGLGLDSFVFLDDNPGEVQEVQQQAPEVLCVHFPVDADPGNVVQAAASRTLEHHWALDFWPPAWTCAEEEVHSGTLERASRTELYRQDALRKAAQPSSGLSLLDFVQSLQLEVLLNPISNTEVARVAELSQRANQFHATTWRLTEARLTQWLAGPGRGGLCGRVCDRFGDYGLTFAALWHVCPAGASATLTKPESNHPGPMLPGCSCVGETDQRLASAETALFVDCLVLSCRVLQRGVELQGLQALAQMASQHRLATLRVPYLPTARNAPVRRFLQALARVAGRSPTVVEVAGAELPGPAVFELSAAAVLATDLAAVWAASLLAAAEDRASPAAGHLGTPMDVDRVALYDALNVIPASLSSIAQIMTRIRGPVARCEPQQANSANEDFGSVRDSLLGRSMETIQNVEQFVQGCAENVLGRALPAALHHEALEDLGMTSVQAVHFFAHLQSAHSLRGGGAALPAAALFQRPTIASMAALLHRFLTEGLAPGSDGAGGVTQRVAGLVAIATNDRWSPPEVLQRKSTSLADLGVDEISGVALREALSAEFGVEVPAGWALGFLSLEAIVARVMQADDGGGERAPEQPSYVLQPTSACTAAAGERCRPATVVGPRQRKVESATDPGSGLFHAREGCVSALQAMLASGWDPTVVHDRNGLNALAWAAGNGHVGAVSLLLEAGLDVESPSKEGRTALMWACRNGHLQVVQLLVERGADLHAVARAGDAPALSCSSPHPREKGPHHHQWVRYATATALPGTKKGINCFHWAVWGAALPVAAWLLQRGLPLESENNAGCTAPIWAAAAGSIPMCEWLAERGADLGRMNHWGHGVVNKAAWHGHLELLRWLLDQPRLSEQMFLSDAAGKLPVELAGVAGHTEVAALLRHAMEQAPQPIRPAPSINVAKLRHTTPE